MDFRQKIARYIRTWFSTLVGLPAQGKSLGVDLRTLLFEGLQAKYRAELTGFKIAAQPDIMDYQVFKLEVKLRVDLGDEYLNFTIPYDLALRGPEHVLDAVQAVLTNVDQVYTEQCKKYAKNTQQH